MITDGLNARPLDLDARMLIEALRVGGDAHNALDSFPTLPGGQLGRRSGVAMVTSGAAMLVAGTPPPAAAAAGGGGGLRAQTLMLDSYEARADGAADPVSTSRRLTRVGTCLLTVRGTLSFYPKAEWLAPPPPLAVCGRPEARPRFPSPRGLLGPVGFDAETIFALPTTPERCARLAVPRPWSNFQVAVGTRFVHPRRLPARASRPDRPHEYRYHVRGRGRPVRFRLLDSQATDNYGRLRITVRRAR